MDQKSWILPPKFVHCDRKHEDWLTICCNYQNLLAHLDGLVHLEISSGQNVGFQHGFPPMDGRLSPGNPQPFGPSQRRSPGNRGVLRRAWWKWVELVEVPIESHLWINSKSRYTGKLYPGRFYIWNMASSMINPPKIWVMFHGSLKLQMSTVAICMTMLCCGNSRAGLWPWLESPAKGHG